MILAIRSDSPTATLVLLKDGEVDRLEWEAGRQLSKELLSKILQMLKKQQNSWSDLEGVVVFAGPGSFTGLRIGITVANTLAYSLSVPVAAGRGQNWVEDGLRALKAARSGHFVLPEYGSEPNISRPKK